MEEIFAERLLDTIWRQDITQLELAKRTGLTTAAISHYVNGKNRPNSTALLLIADALNVSIDYLLGRTNKSQVYK